MNRVRAAALAAATLSLTALVGCATTSADASWRATSTPDDYLRGRTVLVSCETNDPSWQRACEKQVATDLMAHGVKSVSLAPASLAATPPGLTDMPYIPAARAAGANAVFIVTLGRNYQRVDHGLTLGIGGFGFGPDAAGGFGLAALRGAAQVGDGYAASGRVTDVASGRLMWTARATAPASPDVLAQLAALSKSVVDAATYAGLF